MAKKKGESYEDVWRENGDGDAPLAQAVRAAEAKAKQDDEYLLAHKELDDDTDERGYGKRSKTR